MSRTISASDMLSHVASLYGMDPKFSRPIHSGWLQKHTVVFGRVFWRSRFFILTKESKLYYFKNDRSTGPQRDPINVRGLSFKRSRMRRFSLVINIPSESDPTNYSTAKRFIVVGENETDISEWWRVLGKASAGAIRCDGFADEDSVFGPDDSEEEGETGSSPSSPSSLTQSPRASFSHARRRKSSSGVTGGLRALREFLTTEAQAKMEVAEMLEQGGDQVRKDLLLRFSNAGEMGRSSSGRPLSLRASMRTTPSRTSTVSLASAFSCGNISVEVTPFAQKSPRSWNAALVQDWLWWVVQQNECTWRLMKFFGEIRHGSLILPDRYFVSGGRGPAMQILWMVLSGEGCEEDEISALRNLDGKNLLRMTPETFRQAMLGPGEGDEAEEEAGEDDGSDLSTTRLVEKALVETLVSSFRRIQEKKRMTLSFDIVEAKLRRLMAIRSPVGKEWAKMKPRGLSALAEILSDPEKILESYMPMRGRVQPKSFVDQFFEEPAVPIEDSYLHAEGQKTLLVNATVCFFSLADTAVSLKHEEHRFWAVKLVVTEIVHPTAYDDGRKIFSPVASELPNCFASSNEPFPTFRVAIAVGNWLLQWDQESSLCVPRLMAGDIACLVSKMDAQWSVDREDFEKARVAMASLVGKWNSSKVYAHKDPGSICFPENANSIMFVEEMIEALELDSSKIKSAMREFLNVGRTTGSCEFVFVPSEAMIQHFSLSESTYRFPRHSQLDDFAASLKNKDDIAMQMDYSEDFNLLRAFDWAFRIRKIAFERGEGSVADEPLRFEPRTSYQGESECPFLK